MSFDEQLNVGVIGVGWFGELHARTYNYMTGAKLVGVCDANLARAEEVAAPLGVRAFAGIEELLADNTIQAVSVCTSDPNHLEPVLAACAAGKHILVEKPMALRLEDCDQMIDAARRAGVKLMPGHVLRFDQRFFCAHEKIRRGELGEISHLYSRRSLPKSAAHRVKGWAGYHTILFHLAVHDLDALCWLADDEVAEVYAAYRAGTIESEGSQLSDVVLSLLKFRKGALAIMEHSWIHPENYPILVDAHTEIAGTRGRIVLDLSGKGGTSYTQDGVQHFHDSYWPTPQGQVFSDLHDELETFVRCIAMNLPVPVQGADGRRAVAAALAIQESLRRHEVVTLDELSRTGEVL
jgi:predicted dehydrogenase